MRWGVICDNFVSLHDSETNAKIHAAAIKDKSCRLPHRVELTDLPYGTRHRGKHTP